MNRKTTVGSGIWELASAAAGVAGGLILVAALGWATSRPQLPSQGREPLVEHAAPTDAKPVRGTVAPPRFTASVGPLRLRPQRTNDLRAALDSARFSLTAFDPRAWAEVPRQLELGLLNREAELQQCGQAYLARAGRAGLALAARVAISGRIEGDRLQVGELSFPEGTEEVPGDAPFRSCLQRVFSTMNLICQHCRSGEVTFPWPLQLYFHPAAPRPAPSQPAGQ
jgi:hypothetical protein